ncbi:amidohydrolase family protein [Microbacterium hydrocarbonoxydans]|uniref:amidohydrolase family protein n=1 Tax=Microbacterium hydrocarbonoxydans TaxID=273678 RepID=UPI0013DA2EA0|nr:amidohydrolase family protein [Microbacterium hydrocarbonoxydans]
MRVLDSHLHLWSPDVLTYTWLAGPLAYEFETLELQHARIEGAREEAAVFVQAECVEEQFLDEVRWVDSIADAAGVRAIVAGARLDRGDATLAHFDALAAHDRVVGVRHLLQGEPDGLAGSPAFVSGARALVARGWSFDACVRAHQLPDVAALAAAVPELRIVLDHLGKPEVGTASAPVEPSEQWLRDLGALAQHSQVFCKLSGLPAEAGGDWDAAQLEPFLDAALAAFGPERLMWGSDWPVSVIGPAEPGDPYAPADGSDAYQPTARRRWAQFVATWAEVRGLDVDAILWRNAAGFYRV